MQFILKNKKVIALLLIVAQLIVNAGTQTFAVSFSKVMSKTLEGMEQPEDISTRYYEEFRYEARTYLFNDGESFDEKKSDNDNIDENEFNDEKNTDEETKENVNVDDKKEETTNVNDKDDIDEYDDSLDDIAGDYEDVPEELDDDGNVINPTTRPSRNEEYEEEPEEEPEEEDGARETRPYEEEPEEEPEEDETTVEETTEEETTEEETTEEETTEEATTTEEAATEEETTTEGAATEEETTINETTVASISEAEEVIEEEVEVATSSELEDEIANDENIEIENEVASISETLPLKKLASLSTLKKFDSLLGATPVGGDGTHVHKICGVAEGAACLHTEVAEHTQVGDYRLIAADENEIMAEVIDDLIGRIDDGEGNYENITEPEYLVLGRDIEFDKSVAGNPRDADSTADFYTINLVRDLYLCLNGHSIKNIRWTSSTNKQLFITNCGATAEVTSPNMPANYSILDLNVKMFGVNKNIIVRSGRIASIENAERGKSTFFGVIFDGYNTTAGVQYVFQYTYDSPGHVFMLEDCEFRNYKNDAGTAQAQALIRMNTRGTLILNNVKIYDNDGLQNHIFVVTNPSGIGRLTTRGRCEIYDNNMSTGTGNANCLHWSRTIVTIEGDGLYIYNNSKTPGARFVNLENSAVLNIEENATLKIDNNKLAKATTNHSTIFIYLPGTINAKGNLYLTNNKVINCGTINTGVALAGIWVVKNQYINIGNGIIKVEGNKGYADDGVTLADDKKYSTQHMYQIYCDSKDATEIFKMMSGCKFNPSNSIGPVGFPSGQSGKIMKFTTAEVDDPSIVSTVFKVDNYYFKDYVVDVKDNYVRAVHRESDHKHKECGVALGTACTHQEVAEHTKEIMYYELSGDLAISGRAELITGFSSTDATEYFYLTDDIDSSSSFTTITLKRDVYICLNGHSIKGMRFAKCEKTVVICNCKENKVLWRTSGSGTEMYLFDCNAYMYGNQNKNIKLESYGVGRIAAGYGSKIYIYGVDIDSNSTTGYKDRSRAYVNKKGGHFIMENVDLHNCHTTTERFMYVRGDDKAGGSFTIRDVNSYDMSGLEYQIVRIGGKSGAEGTFTIKGNCSFNNIKMAANSAHLVYGDTYSSMIIDEGATLTFNGNTITSGADCIFKMVGANAKLRMRGRSKLIIENNSLSKTTANQGFLLFDSGTHYLFGDIEIKNNNIINCSGKKSDYIGGLLASKDATLYIGSGSIKIDNNKAYLDNKVTLVDDRAIPQHHMYGFISGKTDLALNQYEGTKFSPETYIPNFAFMGYAAGTVAKWTENEYEDYYKASFSELVIADTTYTPDFKVVNEENKLVIKSASDHYHKICGLAEGEECTHTEISKHTDVYQWSAVRIDTIDAFVQALTGTDGATTGSYYYLSDDIISTSNTSITPKRDVYLCLNGHDMKGFKFAGSKSVYITNCKTDDNSMFENKTTDLAFVANTYLYGINKNITFHTSRLCDIGGGNASNNKTSHFYNIIVDGSGLSVGTGYATLFMGGGASRNLVIEDVVMQNISGVSRGIRFAGESTSKAVLKDLLMKNCSWLDDILYSDGSNNVYLKGKNEFTNVKTTTHKNVGGNCSFYLGSKTNFEIVDGELNIHDCESTENIRKSLIYIDNNFKVNKGAKLLINNNTQRDKTSNDFTSVLYFEKSTNVVEILGDMEITGNKIINCGTNNQKFIAAVYFEIDKVIKIASGSIVVKDNKAYKDAGVTLADDNEYVAQHAFQFLLVTRDNNIFEMTPGYKINRNSKIDGIAFYSATGAGQIMEWNSNVTDDLNSYENIFIADKFFNPILDKRVENGILLLDYSAAAEEVHKHKLCGISTRSACTHTETAAHTEGISYKPLGPNVVKDPTIMSALLVDSSGKSTKPNCFYLIEDLINTGDTIQTAFTVDTYICLNGHTIKGFELRANSTSTMNVTNCSSTMGKIDLKGAKTIAFTTNTRAYGVNKNITIYAPRLCWASTNLNEFYSFIMDGTGSSGYSTDQWGIIHGAGDSASIKMEKVEMKNIQSAWSIVDLPSRKNFEMVMKDVAFKNCKIVDVPFYIVGTDNTLKLTIKGTCEITDNNFVKSGNTNGVFQLKNARLTLNQNSTLKISDNTMTNHGRIMFLDSGYFYTDANSNFVVTGNKFNKNKSTSINSGNTELVQIGASNNCTMLGNVTITDNKIVDCGTNTVGTYMSALSLLGTGNSINVGNGVITVDGNKAYSDGNATTPANDTTYKNQHLFQVYSYNTSLVFKQTSGTKFNTNSRMTVTMQGISEGKVADWNTNTTDDISAYRTVFKTDYFGDPDPMLVVYKNDSVQLVSSSNYHFHKICGAATKSNCTHTLVTDTHDNVEFSRLGTTISADQFVNTIKGASGQAPAYYYLRSNVTTTSEKEIALQRDVYICLNGFSISGFRFSGNGKKVYICNCRDDKVSTIKNVLSTSLLFATNVQIYGSTRSNVVVNSGRIIDVTTTYVNNSVSFYNVDFDGTNAKDIIWKSGKTTYEATTFYLAAYTTNFENVKISNYINNKKFLIEAVGSTVNFKNVGLYDNRKVKWSLIKIGADTSKATLNIEGKVELLRNESYQSSDNYFFYTCGDINVKDNASLLFKKNLTGKNKVLVAFFQNGCLTTGENSYFGLVENVVEKFTGDTNTGLLYINDKAKDMTIKGDFEIKNNRIAKCGTSTSGNFLYGLYMSPNRFINVGSGKITIQNNKSYSDWDKTLADDTKYKTQHMYQVYADHSTHKTNGLFKVISGKKFNTESRIEGVAYNAYNYNGNVIKWDTTTVDTADLDKFSEIFTADAYKDDELSIGYDATNGWVIIEYGAPKHRHKLCGVATTSDCAHTAAASHGDNEVGYRKLTKEADRSTLTSSLAQGGAFVLLDDIDPAALGDNGAKNIAVTVSNDLYLCLNGHSLKGITFTGGPTKSVFITNCSTKKGTFENTVNSVAAFTNISAEINGINKNIDVLYDKLAYMNGAASYNQRIRLYSVSLKPGRNVKIADSYIYITQSSNYSSSIEDCAFENMNAYSLFRSDGNRTVRIKNNIFKNMTIRNFFMSFDKGTTKLTFEGNNVVDNIRYANEASDYFIHLGSYAGNEVTIDGNLTITNNESYFNSNHFFHISAGKLKIKENSKLTMNGNKLYNTAIQSRAILYTGDNVEVSLMGSLEIKDNAFVGTRQSHSDFGFRYGNAAKPVTIGSTSILITNNTTTNARANVRDFYSYYSSGALEQTTGTKFNVKESRIDRVAMNSEDYTGEIYNTWNRDSVSDFDDRTFDEVFGADDYAGRKGIIVAKFGEKIILTFGDHFHKVCGTLATESCVHPGIEDHGMGTSADVMKTYLALRWGNMNELKSTLEAGGTYFLIRKIKFDTPTVIDVRDADLILCLKGFYIENAIFTSSTGKKIYISTCVEQIEQEEDEEEEIEYDDDGQPIPSPTAGMGSKRNDRNEVALVATASGIGAMFKSAVELYSPYNLLNVYANKFYESTGNNSGDKVILSGVNLHNDPKTANAGNYIEVTGNEEMVLEGVSISTMSNVGCVVKTENSTLTLCGDINVYKNEDLRSLFDAKSINQKNGSVKVYDNLIKRIGGQQNIIKISTASYLYGTLEVTNNKVINADASNNSGFVAILNVASPGYIHLGNTKIVMNDNESYSDEGYNLTDLETYESHYVYSIYSNNYDGIFVQDSGNSINASTRVHISFASPKFRGTVVRDWNAGDIYDTVFKADHNIDGDTGFNRIRMNVALEGSNVILDDRIRIYFKEGISEKKKQGTSPISITQIVQWGDPYKLEKHFKWQYKQFKGYIDERGMFYFVGMYPNGLVLDRGSVTLTAVWADLESTKNDIPPTPKDGVNIKRDAVIIGGQWMYDTIQRKWMYYLNSNVTDNIVNNIFPNGDSGIYVGLATTESRLYLRNGIYQIYYNGDAYYFRFDENGYMVTGFSEANGSQYYFNESGILEGAMQMEPIVLGTKKLIFDVYGRIVREMDDKTGEVEALQSVYQKMVGMDDYYDPIPSLVGWN